MSVCLLVIGVLFGTLSTYIYMPISIIVGILVCLAIKKGMDRRRVNIIASITYVIAEVLVAFVIFPLFGVSVSSQLDSMQTVYDAMVNMVGTSATVTFSNVSSLLAVVFIVATILTGVLEGYLTGILTTILLKKLKIKNIGINSPLDIKMPVYLAYILMLLVSISLFILKIPGLEEKHATMVYIIMSLSVVASLVLAYYGYLFIIIYTSIRFGKKNGLLVFLACVLLFPLSYIILIVVGFLYGTGPLRIYLEKLLKLK